MPENIDDLRKDENLNEIESKIVEILSENKKLAYDLSELAELVLEWIPEQIKSPKDYFLIFIGSKTLNEVLDNLVKKQKINKISARGRIFYYLG
ncbi:hypothetical protein LCGC14_0606540 [marine sediment metagenome]|uniref:Uncharacterized protein n=1 Tax=marine sediment metagenome TaxID=412755 RepID=A0A0F9RDT7_9ZZZZ|nr:hypothetical protein [bacterium]